MFGVIKWQGEMKKMKFEEIQKIQKSYIYILKNYKVSTFLYQLGSMKSYNFCRRWIEGCIFNFVSALTTLLQYKMK